LPFFCFGGKIAALVEVRNESPEARNQSFVPRPARA
jgi:hypothetical protein